MQTWLHQLFKPVLVPDAFITTTRLPNDEILWIWEGGEVLEMTMELLRTCPYVAMDKDVISFGPYYLRVIEENFWKDTITTILDSPKAPVIVWLYKVGQRIDRIYRRSVRLAHRWGLAECKEGELITWRNVHVLRWLANPRDTLMLFLPTRRWRAMQALIKNYIKPLEDR
jgi:hypothetical protein